MTHKIRHANFIVTVGAVGNMGMVDEKQRPLSTLTEARNYVKTIQRTQNLASLNIWKWVE